MNLFSYHQEDETEEGSETETGSSEDESETETEGGYTDEEGLDEERQSGDGEVPNLQSTGSFIIF